MIRLLALVFVIGCTSIEGDLDVPQADPVTFRTTVYPVLLADCGFPACHGSRERFFRVFGPGRTRLAGDTDPYAPATPEELAESFTRARSMLISPDGVRRSPLLRKPLAVTAGGAGHEGTDAWGANLYATKQDPHFQALFFWATAAGEP
ncbi:MAG: hypothetical protein AB7T06_16185 [Kofleriaceae bacterium]